MKHTIYVDIETSGLDPAQGAVMLSVAIILEKDTKTNPLSEFVVNIIPTDEQWAAASPEALKVNGLTLEYLKETGVSLQEAQERIASFLAANSFSANTFTYVGQNPSFDLKFLQYFMADTLSFFGFPPSDVVDIRDLYSILVNRRVMPFIKYRSGKNISLALGVEPEPDVHDALEGARVVRRNHLKTIELGVQS